MRKYNIRGSCGRDQGNTIKVESNDGYWVRYPDAVSAVDSERTRCASMLDLSDSELLLMAGEMTAQELRTVKAVLKSLKSRMTNGTNV